MSLEIGQRLELDLSGLRLGSRWLSLTDATGTIVALNPGVITVLAELDGGGQVEVNVSPARVRRQLASAG